ncbi:uncharacterized protein LOC142615238 [Castanea sativa]|uniref:uncharacterized protein LOC142615238 n=1 Tax=Castanea sativa TaxID=21020 RepID=UPI003F64B97E
MQIPNEASLSQLLDDPSTLPPSQKFYSHARRPRPVTSDSTPMPKKGRGTLKGLKVAKKASETSDGKLSITFSRKFGGPIDINYRTFVDSVVVQVRQHLPLNVKNWKEIPDENKNILKAKVLNKWRLDDDDDTQAKIFKIAKERYRGWRADLSATYKTYKHGREAVIQNKPQELNMDTWYDVISYFESDDFKRDPETQEEPDDL